MSGSGVPMSARNGMRRLVMGLPGVLLAFALELGFEELLLLHASRSPGAAAIAAMLYPARRMKLRRSIWSLTYTTTLSHGQVANWPRPVVAVNPKEMTRPGPSRSSPITPGVRREHRGWSTVDGDGAGAGQRGVRL